MQQTESGSQIFFHNLPKCRNPFFLVRGLKETSDIDLAVKGPVSKDTLSALLTAFEESLLPYFVDVVIYEHITNEALREHIDRVGISIYKS